MKKSMIKLIMLLAPLALLITNCATVKPYQKAHLNDEDMKLSNHKLVLFETNFQSYREGASGAEGGKVGGGCGCN